MASTITPHSDSVGMDDAPSTVVLALPVLLLGSVSPGAFTVAVFTKGRGPVYGSANCAVKLKLLLAPLAKLPTAQVTALPLLTQPSGEETKLTPTGKVSTICAPTLFNAPLLLTVSV